VRRALPEARVEVLTPDFCGDLDAVARVLDAVACFQSQYGDRAAAIWTGAAAGDYRQSLGVLRFARTHAPAAVLTKSGFMVGLGETADEVHSLLGDLRQAGADVAPSDNTCSPRAAICRWRNTSRSNN